MRDNRNSLIRRLLSGITNEELENLVRVREGGRAPIPPLRSNVQQYRPVRAPRKKKQQPVAAPRKRIDEKRRALKGEMLWCSCKIRDWQLVDYLMFLLMK